MNKFKHIKRTEDEALLNTVARALSDPFTAAQYQDSAGTDYHHVDVSDFMSVAITEDVPLSDRLSRQATSRGLNHAWLEQELPRNPTAAFTGELVDPTGLAIVPKRYSNTMGKLAVEFEMSDLADTIARSHGLEGVGLDEMGRQLHMKFVELQRNQELALLEAVESTTDPYAFRGLLGDYKNGNRNGWIGGVETRTSLNFGGAELTAANAEATLNSALLQFYSLRAGPKPTSLWLPPRALTAIRSAASAKVQVFMTQSELANMSALNLGGKVGMFYSDYGFLEIYAHPDLLVSSASGGTGLNAPAVSRMLLLYLPGLKITDFASDPGVTIATRAKTRPTTRNVISEDITLEVRNLPSQGEIRNFWIA